MRWIPRWYSLWMTFSLVSAPPAHPLLFQCPSVPISWVHRTKGLPTLWWQIRQSSATYPAGAKNNFVPEFAFEEEFWINRFEVGGWLMWSRFFPTFSSIRFILSNFMWRSTWTWACTRRYEWVNFHSSTCWPPIEPAPYIEKYCLFPLDVFGSFVKDQVTIGVWVPFWTPCILSDHHRLRLAFKQQKQQEALIHVEAENYLLNDKFVREEIKLKTF